MNINQHDLSDDELDHLFSDAAEKMDFDFEPDSWTKMNKKLDEANLPTSSSQTASVWSKRALIILIGLLFLTGVYYFSKTLLSQSSEVSEKAKSESEKPSESNVKINVSTDKVATYKSEDIKNDILEQESETENKTETVKNGEEEKVVHNELKNTLPPTNEVKIEKSNKNNSVLLTKSVKDKTVIVVKNNVFEKNYKQVKTSKKGIFKENNVALQVNPIGVITKKSDLPDNINETPIVTLDESNARLISKDLQLISPKSTSIQGKYSFPAVVYTNKTETKTSTPTSQSTAFKKGLYLRVATSPELSLVTIDEMAKLGNDWAALLEYRFNNRLSMHSGLIRSMKYYNAYPEGYQWPSDWKQPPALIDINASCKMLDIPLNIRYDITQKNKSRMFVTTGVTSYVMLNEKYIYNYENPADPAIKWKNWEGKTGIYKLSNINFSAGYEYQFFRKLSLQVEPFVKVPLSKVGFGKVNLSTIGIFFSAKYPIK